jgi:hypothetical protein
MGISLFGLTPAATYPALIKFGDNSAISGTLRALSDGLGTDLPIQVSTTGVNFTGTASIGGTALSPSSGVAGAIQFSNGSAFVSDAANLFWDDTNNRLGVGTNTPTATTHIRGVDQLQTSTSLLVTDSIGTELLRVHNSANNSSVVMTTAKIANYEIVSGNVLANTTMRFVPTSTGLAINKDYSNPAASTLVHIKGSGTTGATTSLLVQNSAGTEAVKVFDNLRVDVRTEFRVLDTAGNNAMIMYGDGVSGTKTLWVAGSLGLGGAPGNNASARLQVDSTTQGFLPPRMTTTQRDAIATPATGLKIYNTTLGTTDTYDGATWQRFGQQTFIKGSGSTSATTSLLVQNSTGTSALTVRDDLTSVFGGPTTIGGDIIFVGNLVRTSRGRINFYGGDGEITLTNSTESSFNVLRLGGLTSSFPAIKRNGTAIDFRLADDSGFTNISANNANLGSATTGSRLSVRGDGTNPIARFENSAGTRGFIFTSIGDLLPISTSGQEFITAGYDGGFRLDGSVMALARNAYDSQPNVRVSLSSSYGGGFEIFPNIQNQTSGNIKILHPRGSFAAAAGSANYRPLQVEYTLNNSGAQTGTATGIFLNATETALNGMGHNLMDLQNNGVSMLKVQRLGQLSSIGYSIDAARFRFNNQNYNTNFGYIQGNSNGVFSLIDNTEANFNRLQFGGTTSSFPSIKRNATAIDFRLADDSAFAPINAGATTLRGSGSTSATTSLLVQNSGGRTALKVADNGVVTIGADDKSGEQLVFVGLFGTRLRILTNSVIDGITGSVINSALDFTSNDLILSSKAASTTSNVYIIPTSFTSLSGSVLVNTTTDVASSVLTVNSTTKGFLPPRMTTTQKNAIASPAAGLTVYDSTTNKLNYNNGTTWKEITPDGYTGLVTINALPPVTFDIQNGIIVNVI